MRRWCELVVLLAASVAAAQPKPQGADVKNYPKAMVSFEDFKSLVSEVEAYRASRLVDLDTFLKMSREPNTIIFDARSDFRFDRKHLKGAKHLSFSDFTSDNLRRLVPDPNTRILIYCNNNFDGDQVDFATKMAPRFDAPPRSPPESQILGNRKPIMLALNIPTFINLYGYGYRNVYELGELVQIDDKRITFEGSVVGKK
ncbi:MAG: rhodanese-like domain-containing protein [Myxococcaceae bacterium]